MNTQEFPARFTDPTTSLVAVQFAKDGVVYVERPEGMYEVISSEMPLAELQELNAAFTDAVKYPWLLVTAIKQSVTEKITHSA